MMLRQRLTPKRIERLKGAVIKDITTERIPKDNDPCGNGFTSAISIELADGRSLLLCAQDTEVCQPVCEILIEPKKKGGE